MAGRILVSTTRASRTAKRRVVAFSAVLLSSILLVTLSGTAPVKELQRGLAFALSPFQDAVHGLGDDVGSIFGAVAEIDRLRVENSDLRAENDRLDTANRQLQALGRENEQLAALLQIRGTLGFETVAARVTARETADVGRIVTIDVGTNQGIRDGDVVVAAGGALAGRVKETGPTYARVVLVNDPASTVIGEVVASRATGEVNGDLGGTLIMDKIDATERIAIGDEVVTAGIVLGSGIRSPYPKGLVIGRVVDVVRESNAVLQTALLEAAVDLDRLEYVLVITDYEGGIPDPAEIPTDRTNPDGTLPDTEQPYETPAPTLRPSRPPASLPTAIPTARP